MVQTTVHLHGLQVEAKAEEIRTDDVSRRHYVTAHVYEQAPHLAQLVIFADPQQAIEIGQALVKAGREAKIRAEVEAATRAAIEAAGKEQP